MKITWIALHFRYICFKWSCIQYTCYTCLCVQYTYPLFSTPAVCVPAISTPVVLVVQMHLAWRCVIYMHMYSGNGATTGTTIDRMFGTVQVIFTVTIYVLPHCMSHPWCLTSLLCCTCSTFQNGTLPTHVWSWILTTVGYKSTQLLSCCLCWQECFAIDYNFQNLQCFEHMLCWHMHTYTPLSFCYKPTQFIFCCLWRQNWCICEVDADFSIKISTEILL